MIRARIADDGAVIFDAAGPAAGVIVRSIETPSSTCYELSIEGVPWPVWASQDQLVAAETGASGDDDA